MGIIDNDSHLDLYWVTGIALHFNSQTESTQMYVCICKAVTDREIRCAVTEGARTVRALRKQLGCTGQCGKCKPQVRAIRDEVLAEQDAAALPVLAIS
jgi:bacterioferritin-associated ferredoxin